MKTVLVCEAIACPFWSGNSKTYGCQRWSMSNHCHLAYTHPELKPNEYALYLYDPMDLDGLKRENNRFFLEDEAYSRKVNFFKKYPELAESSFVPKEISND